MDFIRFETARRVGKHLLVALGVAGALSFSPILASADSLTAINLNCGDGFPLKAIVDLQTLTDIQDALTAMTNNPSGMTCLLSTSIVADPLAKPTTGDPYFVGGGRYVAKSQQTFTGACFYNFGVSAHLDADGTFHGSSHVVETTQAPAGSTCTAGGGHIKASVNCVMVDSLNNIAGTSGLVTDATGDFGFAAPAFNTATSVSAMYTHVTGGTPDSVPAGAISHDISFSGVPPCPAMAGGHNLVAGHIRVHS
jgi:hypothetical protein